MDGKLPMASLADVQADARKRTGPIVWYQGIPDQGRVGPAVVMRHEFKERGRFGNLLDRRLDLRSHAPTGFAWGYMGSGPHQLSLAILADALGDDARALALYHEFCERVVSKLSLDHSWTLTDDVVRGVADQIEAGMKAPEPEPAPEPDPDPAKEKAILAGAYCKEQFDLAQVLAERFGLPRFEQWCANKENRTTMPQWWWNAMERRKQFVAEVAGQLAWLEKQTKINGGNKRLNRLLTGAAE